MTEPPPDVIDPDLVADDDGVHLMQPTEGPESPLRCLECGAERKGRLWRARGEEEWTRFRPPCGRDSH